MFSYFSLREASAASNRSNHEPNRRPGILRFTARCQGEIKWQIDLVYVVGAKMFCVACEDKSKHATVSFKVDDDLFLPYTDRPGFIPAPYMARAKWVQVNDLCQFGDAELKALIKRSHELVCMKLTKKLRAELGLN